MLFLEISPESTEYNFNPMLLLIRNRWTVNKIVTRLQSDLKLNIIHQGLFSNDYQLTANNMAVNLLKRAQKGLTNHVLEFAKQTALGGPKYFANRGTIEGGYENRIYGTDDKTGKIIVLKMSRFDRLVAY